jgi:hypothetical protein
LQKYLAGYYKIPPKVIQTGTYGPTTGAYVKRLQKQWGVPPSGAVGPLTRSAIFKRCRTNQDANTQAYPTPVAAGPITTANTFTPAITSIDPTSGPVGTKVYIKGTGFGGDNTVNFSDAHVSGIAGSSDGNYIVFTVPNYNPDSYGISVTSPKWGTTSNVVKFVLTSGNTQKLPMVSQVVPSTASVGETIQIQGSGFTASDNIVNFGQYSFGGYDSLKDGTMILPAGVTSKVPPGTYTVSVRNANGDSRDATFSGGPTFTLVSNSSGSGTTPPSSSITLSSATVQGPTSPTDNVQVTIYGTNLKYQSQVYFGGTKCNTLATYNANPESLTAQVDANTWYNSCGGSSPIDIKAQSTDGSFSNAVVGNATSPYTAPQGPTITGVSSKGAGSFETYANAFANVTGSSFGVSSGLGAPTANLGGIPLGTSGASDTSLQIAIPANLAPGRAYDFYLVSGAGVRSNVVQVYVNQLAQSSSPTITISSVNVQAPPVGSPGTAFVTIFGTNLNKQSQVYFGNCNTLANYNANPESLSFAVDASFFYNSCQGNSPTIVFKVQSTDGSYSNTKTFPQVSL